MNLIVETNNNSRYIFKNKINKTQKSQSNNTNIIQEKRKETRLKQTSILGSVTGVLGAMCLIEKKNPLVIIKKLKNPKQIINGLKKIEFNGTDVMKIASGSVLGGFVGGSVVDSEHSKQKVKEGVSQLVGNYIVPSAFVGAGIKLVGILNKKFNFPPNTKMIKFAFGMLSLIGGVITGNKISNEVTKKVFKDEKNRKLSKKDYLLQADNLCLVTSMANEGTKVAKTASKFIPIMHFIPGYIVGTRK